MKNAPVHVECTDREAFLHIRPTAVLFEMPQVPNPRRGVVTPDLVSLRAVGNRNVDQGTAVWRNTELHQVVAAQSGRTSSLSWS